MAKNRHFQWFYSVGHVSYLLFLCYQDETFRSGSAFISLTAKTSATVILFTTYMILGFDILSLFVDLLITLVNRRHIRRYSLHEGSERTTGFDLDHWPYAPAPGPKSPGRAFILKRVPRKRSLIRWKLALLFGVLLLFLLGFNVILDCASLT